MKLKTLLLTLLISTSLIGTAQALTLINKYGKVAFEGADKFTKFDIGIPLTTSDTLLVGFKDLLALL